MNVNTTLDGAPVVITTHAFRQLRDRIHRYDEFDILPEDDDQNSWREKLELLVAKLYEEEMEKRFRIQRCINNEFVQARYFYNKDYGLRFVVKDTRDDLDGNGTLVVMTIERPYPYSRHGKPLKH